MQTEEHAVGKLAYLQHVFAEAAGAFELSRRLDLFYVRRGLFDRDIAAEPVGRVESVLKRAVIVLQPHEHIHEYRLMPKGAQRSAHACARHKGDMALRAYAAAQYNNFH